MINAIMMVQIPFWVWGVVVEWGLTSLSPVLSVVINNDDDDSHLYSFVILESFRLSASFRPRYFICSHHNMQYLFYLPLETWSLIGSEKAIQFTSLYTNKNFAAGDSDGKESACNVGELASIPGLGRFLREGHGNPLQFSCLENPHGQRSLMSCSPWGRKESDTTGWLSTAHIYQQEPHACKMQAGHMNNERGRDGKQWRMVGSATNWSACPWRKQWAAAAYFVSTNCFHVET